MIQGIREDEKADAVVARAKARLNSPLISVGEDNERQAKGVSLPTYSAATEQNVESGAENGRENSGVAAAHADEDLRRQHAAIQRFIEEAKAHASQKQSGVTRALRWLIPGAAPANDRRRAVRQPTPELVAYYAEEGDPQMHEIGNISSSGAYLETQERWPPGELVPLILQRKGPPEDHSGRRIRVQAGPARWGANGMGMYFVLPVGMDLHLWESQLRRDAAETEADYVLREFRTARALGFVRRICSPVADEVGRLLQIELSNFRAASAVEIALKAEALLACKSDADKMLAHPKMVVRIIELGSWADIDLLQRFWAGLLAASCTVEGQDESNSTFVDMLSVLTLVHARILAAACARATKVTSASGAVSIYPLYCAADEICKIAGTNDFSKIHRAIALLADLGLLEKSAHSSFVSYTEKAKTTPTNLGLEMYARCNGLRAAP